MREDKTLCRTKELTGSTAWKNDIVLDEVSGNDKARNTRTRLGSTSNSA